MQSNINILFGIWSQVLWFLYTSRKNKNYSNSSPFYPFFNNPNRLIESHNTPDEKNLAVVTNVYITDPVLSSYSFFYVPLPLETPQQEVNNTNSRSILSYLNLCLFLPTWAMQLCLPQKLRTGITSNLCHLPKHPLWMLHVYNIQSNHTYVINTVAHGWPLSWEK